MKLMQKTNLPSNEELIKSMRLHGYLKNEIIQKAFQTIDRKDFAGENNLSHAYDDRPLPIGKGQTISQPSTVAFMLEKLGPRRGDKILDLGSGSGWTTGLLAYIAGPDGRVVGVEIVPELVALGQNNLAKYNFTNVSIQKTSDILGAHKVGPFDRILVSAEAQDVPTSLIDQLRAGGKLVLPIRGSIEVVQKNMDGSLSRDSYHGFRFVPLV